MVKLYGKALYNIIVTDSMIIIMMVIQNGHNLIRCGHVFKVFCYGKKCHGFICNEKVCFLFDSDAVYLYITSSLYSNETKQTKTNNIFLNFADSVVTISRD